MTTGYIANTPESIETMRLIHLKSALSLESKGMKAARGPKLRKPTAIAMGLKSNASYDEVIKAIKDKLEERKNNPEALLKAF
jgi:hypothetical protein